MAKVNDFINKYYKLMEGLDAEEKKTNGVISDETSSDEESTSSDISVYAKKIAAMEAYSKKYEKELKNVSPIINDFMNEFFPDDSLLSNNNKPFADAEFIKALSDIIKMRPDDGLKVIGMAFAVLQEEAETIMPFDPMKYKTYLEKLNKALDKIVEYGVKNGIIDASDVKKNKRSEASMNEETVEAATSENKNDKKADETATTEEAVEKNSSENKSKKEEIEKKKKESNERRARTKKWFDYDSFELESVKKNTKDWYRITNRISKLFDDEEVQNFVNDSKFKMLIFENSNNFALANETGNIVLWFKDKHNVAPFTNPDLFKTKWAEAHQTELKFTA